jgi:hypothetical protein
LRRRAKRRAVAADDQNLAECDDLTGLALDLVDPEHVLGGYPVLLAAGFEDREHLCPRVRSRYSDIHPDRLFLQSILLIKAHAGIP